MYLTCRNWKCEKVFFLTFWLSSTNLIFRCKPANAKPGSIDMIIFYIVEGRYLLAVFLFYRTWRNQNTWYCCGPCLPRHPMRAAHSLVPVRQKCLRYMSELLSNDGNLTKQIPKTMPHLSLPSTYFLPAQQMFDLINLMNPSLTSTQWKLRLTHPG